MVAAESRAIESIITQIQTNTSHAAMWTKAVDLLENCQGHAVFCGMGKSGLIGAKLSATFSSIGQPSHVVHPAEAVHVGDQLESDILGARSVGMHGVLIDRGGWQAKVGDCPIIAGLSELHELLAGAPDSLTSNHHRP